MPGLLIFDIEHIGEHEMTRYTTQSFAALAAFVLAIGLWVPTVAPVADTAIVTVAVAAAPEMA
jgi:hypothetical protein